MSSAYGCADGNRRLRVVGIDHVGSSPKAVGIDHVGSSPKAVGLARAVGVAW
jgi:hypothetical protein